MFLHILDDAGAATGAAARHIADRIRRDGVRVLGLATGRSPVSIYDHLAAEVAQSRLSLAGITSFNLDEYLGLGAGDPASFHSYMDRHLFSRVEIGRTHLPDGHAPDPAAEALAYDRAIGAAGGIDLQLLGIGRNGHIAFNEPGSDFDSRSRVVALDDSTRRANAPDFPPGQEVPHKALTMGIGTILEAREIVLVATGAAKAQALAAALAGPAGVDCPASALQRHGALRVFADRAAAQHLPKGMGA